MAIDLGVTWDDLEKQSVRELVPDCNGQFVIDHIDESNQSDGRPAWVWWLKLTAPEEVVGADNKPHKVAGRVLRYQTQLAWVNPAGEFVKDNMFALFAILRELNMPLIGSTLADKEFYYSKPGFVVVGHKQRKDKTTGLGAVDDAGDPIIDQTVAFPKRPKGQIV